MDTPNIVWLTLESTRADHCSLHGYGRETTPELDALAGEPGARWFEDCHTHGIWTRSSSASILTGTYPSHHTVGLDTDTRLPDELDTVAELLGRAGYNTGCVSPNPNISSSSGLDRGFDRFTYISGSTLLDACPYRSLAKYALNVRRHSAGLTRDRGKHSFGYLVNDVAKRWVSDFEREDDPYFLYVHYPDTHQPYFPPLPYQNAFTADLPMSTAEAAEITLDVFDDMYRHIATGCQLSERQWAAVEAMYDAQIRYTDHLVGELVRHVRRRSGGDTVVVVTADHGELLGERGLLAHRFTLDSRLTHVPMVVAGNLSAVGLGGRKTRAEGIGEGELVQHADVMETLLSAVGADTSQFQGVDLSSDRREYAFAQRGGERAAGMLETMCEHNPGFDPSRFPAGDTTSVTEGSYRYVVGEDRCRLYRLPEEVEVENDHPAANRLDAAYREFIDGDGQPVTDERVAGELDAGMEQHLEDLGYI